MGMAAPMAGPDGLGPEEVEGTNTSHSFESAELKTAGMCYGSPVDYVTWGVPKVGSPTEEQVRAQWGGADGVEAMLVFQ